MFDFQDRPLDWTFRIDPQVSVSGLTLNDLTGLTFNVDPEI